MHHRAFYLQHCVAKSLFCEIIGGVDPISGIYPPPTISQKCVFPTGTYKINDVFLAPLRGRFWGNRWGRPGCTSPPRFYQNVFLQFEPLKYTFLLNQCVFFLCFCISIYMCIYLCVYIWPYVWPCFVLLLNFSSVWNFCIFGGFRIFGVIVFFVFEIFGIFCFQIFY